MVRVGAILFLFVVSIAVVVKLMPGQVSVVKTEPVYNQAKALRYTFEILNDADQPFQGGTVWVYAPVAQTSFQKVDKIMVSGTEYELQKDHLGNQSLALKVGSMAPGGRKIVTVSVRLSMAEQLQSINLEVAGAYLQAEPYIETDDPALKAFASRFGDMQLPEMAEQIKTTVGNHIEHSGYVRENLGALYAFNEGRGDCTEFMSLSVALFRINNVPARAVAGFVVSGQSAILSSDDYHNWTEFYDDDGWQMLDAQNQKLAELQEQYVVFRVLSGQGEQNNARFSERFVSSDSQLKIKLI